jgi:ketosteroid isomerase-like protein
MQVRNHTSKKQNEHDVYVVHRFFELLHRKELDQWGDLWNDLGRFIFFYPPDGFQPILEGKASIRAFIETVFEVFMTYTYDITALYPSPETGSVCVEYKVRAILTSEAEYCGSNMAVFHFEEGLITSLHLYADPRAFQAIVDALPKA